MDFKDINNIIVSVIVTTYNQEKYIGEALDSILMQKVDFPIEVLVGDDASTDGTQDVLKLYERKYPGFFTMIYRKHNINSEPVGNGLDLRYRSKGKYTILLEGDDYWTDPLKIQKQVTFLERHPDYIAVAHNCVVVDDESKPNGENYLECHDNEYTFEHYLHGILPGQSTTVMLRNIYIDHSANLSLIKKRFTPGDRCTDFTLLCNGKIYCMQETMSAYRHITKGGSSYSANFSPDFKKKQEMLYGLVDYASKIKNKKAYECARYLYVKEIVGNLLHKTIDNHTAHCYMKKIPQANIEIPKILLTEALYKSKHKNDRK